MCIRVHRKTRELTTFSELNLAAPILKALAAEGYETPTPIQAQAIPPLLAGHDLLGIAQTGTGKTAAFALPILDRLARDRRPLRPRTCRALILSPTRELASQIADSIRAYGKNLRVAVTVVVGGVSAGPQSRALQAGVDVLVATPGRLVDHMGMRNIDLRQTEVFVLDEADQMLDLGFIHAIRKVVAALPPKRQNLFFSATMPSTIGSLAAELLTDPVKVSVTPVATTAERVEQRIIFAEGAEKRALLVKLLGDASLERVLAFTRTKHGADKVTKYLEDAGISAAAIHGNKSQPQRERALASFKSGRTRVLVATDIAARGIDVDAVSHVINVDLPNVPESYVHRIGRTARAGATGIAISFCDREERAFLRDIERVTRQTIPTTDAAGNPVERPAQTSGAGRGPDRSGQARQGQNRNGQNRNGQNRNGEFRGGPARGEQNRGGQHPAGRGQRDQGRNGNGQGHGHGSSRSAGNPAAGGPAALVRDHAGGSGGGKPGSNAGNWRRRARRPSAQG